MGAVSRIGPRGGGATFIAGIVINTVQRLRYGRRVAQNSTREVRPARNLVSGAGKSLETHSQTRPDGAAVDPEIK